jgi:hypothetical protein
MEPANVYKGFMEAGNDYADKNGAADLLEGTLKTLKAQLTLQAKALEGCSMVEAENHALASEQYRKALTDSVQARREANRAKVRYEATKALFEAQRSVAATEREAMKAAP